MPDALNINAELVRDLIEQQFPQWATLSINPFTPGGWDNRNFRLGDDMVVRLPSAKRYALQVEKEQHWLPRLAADLPVAIPHPLAMGTPGERYPWHWSIYGWLDGETARDGHIAEPDGFAVSLAGFLNALHLIDGADGPQPGPHNFHRGAHLGTYDAETRRAIANIENDIDVQKVAAIWESALASSWEGAPIWFHGDLEPGNLLVEDGRLSAVIDFGCCGVGDPACDLAIAWTFFDAEQRRAFRSALGVDDACWLRGCGWALWKALIVLSGQPSTDPSTRDHAGTTLRRIVEDGDLAAG
ncbi:MAG: aminoglycoside phosphotransferase family protein [Pseudomonadota bacterium]